MKLKVYYGFDRLNKVMKKPAVSIVFTNSPDYIDKLDGKVRQRINVVHERYQTEAEMTDAPKSNRVFHTYTYFILEKPWKGDLEAVLNENFHADEEHVSLEERELIRKKLREAGKRFLPTKEHQLQLIF